MFDTDIWIKHMAMAVVRQTSLRRLAASQRGRRFDVPLFNGSEIRKNKKKLKLINVKQNFSVEAILKRNLCAKGKQKSAIETGNQNSLRPSVRLFTAIFLNEGTQVNQILHKLEFFFFENSEVWHLNSDTNKITCKLKDLLVLALSL